MHMYSREAMKGAGIGFSRDSKDCGSSSSSSSSSSIIKVEWRRSEIFEIFGTGEIWAEPVIGNGNGNGKSLTYDQ